MNPDIEAMTQAFLRKHDKSFARKGKKRDEYPYYTEDYLEELQEKTKPFTSLTNRERLLNPLLDLKPVDL